MNDIYQVLEFIKIKEQIQNITRSELGYKYVSDLGIISNTSKLEKELTILEDTIKYLYKYGSYLSFDSKDLFAAIDYVSKGASFNIQNILDIRKDIALTNSVILEINSHKDFIDNALSNKVNELVYLKDMLASINKVVDENGNVKKSASSDLSRLYKKLDYLEKRIITVSRKEIEKYAEFIVDNTGYSYKDDHFLLHVKTSYKNKVKGLVYDVSSSRQTTFIEPFEVSEISNDIYLTKKEIEEEIKRILMELSKKIILDRDTLLNNNRIIGYLDFVFSKARYAIEHNCNVIKFNKENDIKLVNASHPLLDKDKVVKNSFYLDKDKRIMVISGPNAGGKTVALKTFAINILLLKCGLAVFASEESSISYVDYIYLDIGDNQSIENNLSTFSAHIKNIAKILERAKENDLIIIDEIGTGTSPKEGEALSVAIIKKIVNLKSYALISSHYEMLKAFALSHPNLINASMEFNEAKLSPTYRLRTNIPGKSYGVELAERFNIGKDVISSAKKILSKQESNYLEEAIKQINQKEKELNDLRTSLEEEKETLDNKLKESEEVIAKYKDKIAYLNEYINEEKEEALEEARKEIDALLKEAYNNENKPHDIIAIKTKLNELSDDKFEVEQKENNEEYEVDDFVMIIDSNLEGTIKAINKNKITISTTDGLTVKVNKNDIKKIEKAKKKERVKVTRTSDESTVPLELNLIGCRVDEALVKLEQYIDSALIHNIKEISVVHGYGSGALRSAIHEYLKKNKFVKDYHLDDVSFNHGVTIIKL